MLLVGKACRLLLSGIRRAVDGQLSLGFYLE
jgi:hypothetical protein